MGQSYPMKFRHLLVWGLVIAFSIAGIGCASLRQVEGLSVALADVRLEEATLWETTAHFKLRLENGTPDALGFEGGVFKIYLKGTFIGQGLTGEPIDLPRFGTVTRDVVVHLRHLSVARDIRRIIEERRLDYQIEGTLFQRVGNRPGRVVTRDRGVLDLRGFRAP